MHYKEAKTLLSSNGGMNVYRGCEHGCIYCDSRSKCYNFTHDFEDIEVKINAPNLLLKELTKKKSRCMVSTGAMCDPYMPIEEEMMITRKCLEVIEKLGCGVALQTKSTLIMRDFELLKKINEKAKCVIEMTLTTYDDKLAKIIEPNVAITSKRFEVLMAAKEAGIPTVLWFCPILPFINDTYENILGILNYAIKAGVYGVIFPGCGVTLREGDREYFYEALDAHFPGLKNKYIEKYQDKYEVMSDNNAQYTKIVKEVCKKNNIETDIRKIFEYMSTLDKGNCQQLSLF